MMTEEYPGFYLYKRIVHAKLYMDRNYALDIDLEAIADEAHFSKFHFIRKFKAIYGLTPHQYLVRVRVQKAMTLLQHGCSVTETCFSVGFRSLTSFAGLFARFTTHSPSCYRQQFRKRKHDMKERPLTFVPHCFARLQG